MALTAKSKEALSKLGIPIEDLIKAITNSAETDITIPEGEFFTPEQLTEMKGNLQKEYEKQGEAKGLQILQKEVAKRMGLEVKSDRIGDFVDALKGEIGKTGDEKVKMLQEQVDLLTKDKEAFTAQIAEKESQYAQLQRSVTIKGMFPENKSKLLTDDEYLGIINSTYKFEEVDGKMIVKKGEEILKDPKTHSPIAPKEAISQLFTERQWVETGGGQNGNNNNSGGRGGQNSNSGGGKPLTKTAFNEQYQNKYPGEALAGAKYFDEFSQFIRDGGNPDE